MISQYHCTWPDPSAAHSRWAWPSTVSHWYHESHQSDELWSSTRERWNPSQVVQRFRPRSSQCLPWYPQSHLEIKRRWQKISKMPWLLPSTKIKVAMATMETTEAPNTFPLLERFLPESSWLAHQHVRSPVWILPRAQHGQHDFLSETASREMHRAEPGFVLHIHWPDQGFWYSQLRGPQAIQAWYAALGSSSRL